MRPIVAGVSGALSAVLLLGACAGSGAGSKGKPTPTTTTNAAASTPLTPIDVCGKISNAQITKIGGSGTRQQLSGPTGKGVQWDICSWGELSSPPVITIHVEQVSPDAPVDLLQTMVDALGSTKGRSVTPIDVGKDGKLYDVALLTYGGAVGKMIVFRAPRGELVVVSETGMNINDVALATLAKQVNAELA